MKASEFIKKYGWEISYELDQYKRGINQEISDCVSVWGREDWIDLRIIIDSYKLVGEYFYRPSGRWFFIADYCAKSKLLSPFGNDVYDMVGGKYDEAVKIIQEFL